MEKPIENCCIHTPAKACNVIGRYWIVTACEFVNAFVFPDPEPPIINIFMDDLGFTANLDCALVLCVFSYGIIEINHILNCFTIFVTFGFFSL